MKRGNILETIGFIRHAINNGKGKITIRWPQIKSFWHQQIVMSVITLQNTLKSKIGKPSIANSAIVILRQGRGSGTIAMDQKEYKGKFMN